MQLGNLTKFTERMTVHIAVDDGQPELKRLSPGLSAVASIDAAKGHSGRSPASKAPNLNRSRSA